MLEVSTAFLDAVDAKARSFKGAVLMHFLGKLEHPFATAVATSQYDVSTPPEQACNGRIRLTEYTCAGFLPEALTDIQKGWWSQQVAGADGTFATNEVLTITYTTALNGGNFWLFGVPGFYPKDFVVERKIDGVWYTVATVTNNTNYEWNYTTTPASTEAVRLIISKIAPANGVARIIQFGLVSTVVFEGADIVDLALCEEISADSDNPLGTVSSNECTVHFNNINKWFAPRHNTSPLYNMLLDGLVFEPYIGVEITSGTYEYVPLGQFFSGDWIAPSEETEATIVGYDRLYNLLSKEVPEISITLNTTVYDMFVALFTAMSVSDYDVDAALTQTMSWGWIPKGCFGDILNELTMAACCSAYLSKMDKLTVKSPLSTAASVCTFTDELQIAKLNNAQLNRKTYASVNVNYAIPTVNASELLVELTDVSIPVGTTTLKNIAFSDGPIASVSDVIIYKTEQAEIINFTWSPWSATLEITSTAVETVTIAIYGHKIVNAEAVVTQDTDTSDGRTLNIGSNLIQSSSVAESYATALLSLVNDPSSEVTVEVRGNPALELLDTVTLLDDTGKFPQSDVIVFRSVLTFDGGLTQELTVHIKPV